MFVPDLMHEFELGVWKAIFTHLLRILYAVGEDAIQKFDERFRKVPTFGRDTIQRSSTNVSAMKKLAARDFEDILQCCIPVFEGLIPSKKYNNIVLDLLFELANWHAHTKLCLHTEHTLQVFERAMTTLGAAVHHFRKTVCSAFATRELPKETAARGRRKATLVTRTGGHGRPSLNAVDPK
ncbi:hypothetical protein SCP_0900380 [Sparassis crispa]|uniref:Uncharacterized protein n=1 Tax=Sparassis crispa TaxID=139825 RepID=A0A401GVA1_9APHY|nr:hypothetical protein SCP_0900380 [Sparassis crispa]GBE86161.1 hypothetical protein SCP_0900380 [Sparassis crispa]